MTATKNWREAIAQAGDRKKLGRAELARTAGIGEGYLSDLINGRRRLSIAAALKLSGALGMDARKLLQMQLDEDIEAAA